MSTPSRLAFGYTMFSEADTITTTMLPDNEIVVKYIEEFPDGVIPERYREPQGRIIMTSVQK